MNLNKKLFAQVLGLILICLVSFVFGAYLYRSHKWPFNQGYFTALGSIISPPPPPQRKPVLLDGLGRLVGDPSKIPATCPQQDEKTAVILLIGQSNIANSLGEIIRSEYGRHIVNYFNGFCNVAESPLLGSTGESGEWGTLLANNLVKQNDFNKVVLISSGISGSSILKWQPGETFNLMLLKILEDVKKRYKINYIIWHQGETDWPNLDEIEYTENLLSLVSSVRQAAVDAPFFVSTTTCCDPGWFADNPMARAQRASRNKTLSIFPGFNSDKLILAEDRHDITHLGGSGQKKIAEGYAKIIHNHRLRLSDD